MKSIVQERGAVPFAAHTGERIYMRPFRQAGGLPFDLAHWQPTVDAMLSEIDVDGTIYLMVDQRQVPAGTQHRCPGMHIDGYWIPRIQMHQGEDEDHPRHCGRSRAEQMECQAMGRHGGHMTGGWKGATYQHHEGLLLASNVQAYRALAGEFIGNPSEGGDCSHIDTRHMQEVIMRPGVAYAGNVTMLHESLPVPFDCLRTVVRLNVPGWSPA